MRVVFQRPGGVAMVMSGRDGQAVMAKGPWSILHYGFCSYLKTHGHHWQLLTHHQSHELCPEAH
jgi:hypothetical protein